MASLLNSPEHPAENLPDIGNCGTGGFLHSRVAEVCPSCMGSLYQTCRLEACCKQTEVKLHF